MTTIFITYDPTSSLYQQLAVRLHTLGVVHGFQVFLPDRSSPGLNTETELRIKQAEWMLCLTGSRISDIVKKEINAARRRNLAAKKILVLSVAGIHDSPVVSRGDFVHLHYRNTDDLDAFVQDVFKYLKVTAKQDAGSFWPFLLTGLGLFALSALAKPGPEKARLRGKKAIRKKVPKKHARRRRQ